MAEVQYLALLRGINVGGNHIIKMAGLKGCFEKMGFTDVATYIQSGNVLFKSAEKNKSLLAGKIEKTLMNRFNLRLRIALLTHHELEMVIKEAPKGFGGEPDKYRYDVVFLIEPIISTDAMKQVRTKDGVDMAWQGKNVLYFSRRMSEAGKSYLNKIIALPVYQSMTIRNWNTTTKLLELMKSGVH